MKTLLIIIAVVVLIPVVLLIFIVWNPPNTLDKDCKYNAEEDSLYNMGDKPELPEDFELER